MNEVIRLLRLHRFSLAASGLALLFTLIFWPVSQRFPFALFIAAVMVSAWRGGLRPGLVATGSSALALLLLFIILPSARGDETGEHFLIRLGMFGLIGVLASYLSMKCRQAVVAHDRFHDTLTSLGEALIFTDARSQVTFLNPTAQTLTGHGPADAEGKPLGEVLTLIHGEKKQRLEDPAARTLRDNTPSLFPDETVVLSTAGVGTPIEGKAIPLRDADERVVGAAVAFHSAAARRQAELEVRQQEQRMRAALGGAPAALLLLDAEGRCLFSNRAAQMLGGFTFDEALGQGWTRCIQLADRDRVLNDWTAALHTEAGEFVVEFRLHRSPDEPRWMRLRASPMFSMQGETLGHVAVLEDATQEKRAEEALHASEAQVIAAASSHEQIEESLNRLREDLQRQLQVSTDARREIEEKLHQSEAQRQQHAEMLQQVRQELGRKLEERDAARRQAEEALLGSRNDFARLMDEHTASRREAEQALQQVHEELTCQLEGHVSARREAEEALRKEREESAPRMEEHAAAQRKAEEALRAVRQDYEQQLEKLTAESLNDMAALEAKLADARQSGEGFQKEAESLREQTTALQARIEELNREGAAHRHAQESLSQDRDRLEAIVQSLREAALVAEKVPTNGQSEPSVVSVARTHLADAGDWLTYN
jgi:PAS domain S-box-containing protein